MELELTSAFAAALSVRTPVAPKVSFCAPHLLIVQPNPELSRRMQQVLEPEFRTTVVSSALVGLRNILEVGRFDLVLCELGALEVPGMQLFDSLAELGSGLNPLALTAECVSSARAGRFLEESGGPWLKQPFSDDELVAFVRARSAL